MDTSQTIIRFARRFFAGTLLSRFSGAVRDIAMAVCFGSAPEISAFMVAYRLANLFRRLLGEGSLQSGFIPHFESLRGNDPQKALLFYRDCSFSLLTVLLLVVGISEVILWGLVHVLSPDWAEVARLTMWMMPGLIFICLYALNSAFLQCQHSYFVSSVAPVAFNLFWILVAVSSSRYPSSEAVHYLSIGIFFAFILQWVMTVIRIKKHIVLSCKEWFCPKFFSSDWKKMIRPLSLGVIGVGAMQINSALDAIFSRMSDLSGPSYLWYAIRIEQLPLALFGIALSGALLPPLSRAVREGADERYCNLLKNALRHTAALIIPCTFGLFVLGGCGLNLLYGHGDFSSFDVKQTLYCLWGYGIGLLPAAFTLLFSNGFYAQKSYAIPAFASLFSVILNIFFNVLMVFVLDWGSFSIAIGTSIASFANCFILAVSIHKRWGHSVFAGLSQICLRLTLCALISFGITFVCTEMILGSCPLLGDALTRSFGRQLIQAVVMGGFFVISFFAMARFICIDEVFDFFKSHSIEVDVK